MKKRYESVIRELVENLYLTTSKSVNYDNNRRFINYTIYTIFRREGYRLAIYYDWNGWKGELNFLKQQTSVEKMLINKLREMGLDERLNNLLKDLGINEEYETTI